MSTTEWFSLLLDPGWIEVTDGLRSANPLGFPGYRPGQESVACASGSIGGYPTEVIAFEFAALGGSLGVVAGERIARSFERAIGRRAAVIGLLASGGARMQEGMVALAQMAKTVVARQALARHGLPFVSYLRHPTTGGVYASFGGLGDVIWAEPGATVGFAGPRVAELMSGEPLPEDSHTAEFALRTGLVDGLVEPARLRERVAAFLDLTLGPDAPDDAVPPPAATDTSADAWQEVQLARHPERPTGRGFAERIATGIVEIRGDRAGTGDTGILAALARIGGYRVGILAHERRPLPSAAFRASHRLIRTAARFRLPLVTMVDTPGADPSSRSEAGGIVRAIAGTFREMLEHPRPTLSVVTGEGGSGGALAFACADRLLALEHSIFSVIAPEGASAILRREDLHAVAHDLQPAAADLIRLGIGDATIAEPPPGAHAHPTETAERILAAITSGLAALGDVDRRTERIERWRAAGNRFLEGA